MTEMPSPTVQFDSKHEWHWSSLSFCGNSCETTLFPPKSPGSQRKMMPSKSRPKAVQKPSKLRVMYCFQHKRGIQKPSKSRPKAVQIHPKFKGLIFEGSGRFSEWFRLPTDALEFFDGAVASAQLLQLCNAWWQCSWLPAALSTLGNPRWIERQIF
eukprot:4902991-Pyramimonas_sp.AAC.1